MRVLAATSHCDRSETYLYRRLREAGVELDVLCDPAATRLGELREAGVPVHPLPFRSRFDWAAVRFLRALIKERGYDIVHTFNKRALTHVMLASRGLPTRILTYRGIIGNLSRWNPEVRWTFFNARLAGIVCVCDAVREYVVAAGIASAKARRIYKGHDPAWYASAERRELERLGIPPGAFVVGSAGHLRPRKGLDTLVAALARLPKGSAHLLLVGSISDPKVMRSIAEHGLGEVVHTPGFRADAAALMGACDLFAMPSLRREGLPRAVIEAMIQGVPAMVTNVGGMPEIVEDGKSGRVVEPGNPAALAEAIAFFAEDADRRRTFGERARERIRTAFDIETTVRETLRFYEDVVCSPRSAR